MAESVQDVWDRFERWEDRYLKACATQIRRMCKKGYSDVPARFLLTAAELGCDPILDLDLDEDHLNARIKQKARFLRAYLADISDDGARFMSLYSRFLHLQSPGRCLTAIGVWLEQSLEPEELEAGASFLFQGFDGSLFLKDLADVDWASMRSVLPFDRMNLQKPDGSKWSTDEREQIKRQLREDLYFDGYEYRVRTHQKGGMLTLDFAWL